MKVHGDNIFTIATDQNFGKMSFLLNPFVLQAAGSGIPTENLILYLDGNTEVYSDAGVTLATDTENVRQVNDQSPQGNTMEQTSASLQPTYAVNDINGRNVVEAAGGDYLNLSTDITFAGGTIYWVGKKEGTSTHSTCLGHNTTSNNYFGLNWANGTTYFHDGTTQLSIADGQNTSNAVRAYVWDFGTDIEIYWDKVSKGTVSATALGSTTFNCIMATNGFTEGFKDYAYLLVYTDVHDATKVGEISDILNETFSPTIY